MLLLVYKGNKMPYEIFNSCAFIRHFSAKEVNFVHIFTCGHGFQKLSPRIPPYISKRVFWRNKNWVKFFIGSLAGSAPEITNNTGKPIMINTGRFLDQI